MLKNPGRHELPLRMLLGLSVLLLACGDGAPEATSGIRPVSQEEILGRLAGGEGPLLLDVRSAREFAGGHVPGALNIPVGEVGDRLDELRAVGSGREIVLYCESGVRAQVAGRTLLDSGFQRVGHLLGDMSAWRQANLPSRPGKAP